MESVPDTSEVNGQDEIDQEIDFQQLLEMLHTLNEIDRSIMLLYMEEYSYNEIAGILGITSTNVGVRINRAKKQLKTLLGGK